MAIGWRWMVWFLTYAKMRHERFDVANKTIDADMIRELASLLSETELSEIEIEQSGLRVRVVRGGVAAMPAVAAIAPAVAAPAAGAAPAVAEVNANTVTSPMVGTVYLAPEPGAPVFINVGDTVAEGQTLFVVEAMKVMNAIPAPKAGKVVQILVTDGQPIEYGEPMIVIE